MTIGRYGNGPKSHLPFDPEANAINVGYSWSDEAYKELAGVVVRRQSFGAIYAWVAEGNAPRMVTRALPATREFVFIGEEGEACRLPLYFIDRLEFRHDREKNDSAI